MRPARTVLLGAALLALSACASPPPPSSIQPAPVLCSEKLAGSYSSLELTVFLGDREVPLTVFHPTEPGTYPLIAFSHGAFAAPGRYEAILGPLAGAGHVVIAPMHVDSEEIERAAPASPSEQWITRNEDMALALTSYVEIAASLSIEGITTDTQNAVAMGHSFGALMAQFAGGAKPVEGSPGGTDWAVENVGSVVGFSPPGPIPTRLTPETWTSLTVPSLTITGDADILPGFIDDWTLHKASYDNAPSGSAQLWTGIGVDHYFGGVFGRVKPADEASRAMFDRAMAQTLGFIERNTGNPAPCDAEEPISGENYERN